jgi:spore germination protein
LIVLSLVVFTTGCWDRVEIEERGFVVGAGIDLSHEEEAEKGQFTLTFQFVIPAGLQSKEGGGKNGSKNAAFFNLSSSASTMFAAARNMSYMTSRSPYLQHLRLILISQDLAASGELATTLDLFLRDHEMRRATKIMVTEGEARNLLDMHPKNEKLPAMYFESASLNPTKSSRIYPPTNIGDVQAYILSKSSFVLPKMRKRNEEVVVSGAALFDGSQKLKGFLNDDETSGLNILRGTAQDGVLEFRLNGHFMAYEIKGLRRTIQADVSHPERIRFNLQLDMEGNIGETQEPIELLDPGQLAEIEERIAKQLTQLTSRTLQKVQQEYGVDVLGLREYLARNHHGVWESIKDDWEQGEQLFTRSEISVDVRTKVRIVGSTLETN